METPVVSPGAPKPDVQKPAREATPARSDRSAAPAGDALPDRTAISARSRAAAARARTDDASDGDSAGRSVRLVVGNAAPDGPTPADTLARETSRLIVGQPAEAARAQANSQAASVLTMLR
jgi:hypothetical protein